jgi:FkbM family methyltransferase
MRVEDISDFFKLRKICENPYEVLRFRKVKDGSRRLTVKFNDGYRIFIQGGTDQYHTFHRIYLRDEYRIDQCDPKRMKCVIDLGANVGFFSTRMSTLAEKVICCEPVKSNLELIKINLDGRKNIEIVPKAVAGQRGFINLFRPSAERMSARYSMVFSAFSKGEDEFESVACITLDDLFDEHRIQTCDLLKIDIEGAEYETLYNTGNGTLNKIDRIAGEYHHLAGGHDACNMQALKKFLAKKGYRVETVPSKRKENMGLFFCQRP